jgi:hypothetical protein
LGAIVLCVAVGLEKVWVWKKLCEHHIPLENMLRVC